MPFLKVLPEKEEDQVKFIEVSAVYEPEKQEESNEAIIDAAQEITPTQQIDSPESIQESPLTEPEPITPEESESEQDDTPPLVDDIDIIDETITQPATEPTQESPGIEPVTQEPTQENTHESEPMPEPVDEQREQEEAAPVESTPPEQTNESESTQDTLPAPVDNIDIIDETTPPDEPPEPTPIDTGNKYTGEDIKYDVTSGKRYVDLVSTKTDFDRMLDELAAISKDIIEHEAERFAKKYTGKFQGGFDKAEADAKKYDAFLGGYITNAAMLLYDRGHREVAISKLEETCKVLEARKRLEDETAAIKTRVEEEDAVVDLSDILGLFGDG